MQIPHNLLQKNGRARERGQEHFPTHFMKPTFPWYQNQPEILKEKKPTEHCLSWTLTLKILNAVIWIFVSPQNAYVEILTPKDDYILVGGVIGRWLGHEDRALINEISAHIGLSWMWLVLSKIIPQNP